MRFSNQIFPSLKSLRRCVAAVRPGRRPSTLSPRLEALENRELLAAAPTGADLAALSNSYIDENENAAIWVTSLSDVSSSGDGLVTLREAIEYAGLDVGGKTLSSTIRFSVGGKITLSKTAAIGKNLTIDASDVGGVVLDRGGQGAVLFVYNGSSDDARVVSLTDLTLTGGAAPANSASYSGVGLSLGPYCNLTAVRCSISDNVSSGGFGVGVYVDGGALTLIDSTVSNNVSTGSSVGGGIYVDSGSLTATRTTFEGNSANEGGAVYLKGGSASFDGVRFVDSVATLGSGGALYNLGGALLLNNTSFCGSTAAGEGGAVFVSGGGEASTQLVDSFFFDNSAVNGGALYLSAVSASLTGGEFNNNVATTNGGAVYVAANAELDVEGTAFVQNSADGDGGAINNAGFLALRSTSSDGDGAEKCGGSIFSSGYFEIRDSVFNDASANEGGAIYAQKSSDGAFAAANSWIFRSTASNNSATYGGAIYNGANLSVVDSKLTANRATSGGALYNAGTFFISESEIENNEVEQVGGGVLNSIGAAFSAENCSICVNVATSQGGGIANFGSVAVDASTVRANVASAGFGGGFFNSGALVVRYSTLSDNEAQNGGGVSNALSGTATFSNSSLCGNVATEFGGAAYCVGSTSFTSAYLARNVASTAATALYYLNPGSDSEPTFDSRTVRTGNIAASSVVPMAWNAAVVVRDAANGSIVDAPFEFGAYQTGAKSSAETFEIFNAGGFALAFSNLQSFYDGIDSANAWTVSAKRADGTTVDLCSSFSLARGESIFVTISASAIKVGAKSVDLRWTTRTVAADGTIDSSSATTVRVAADVKFDRSASASLKTTDATVAFGESGSVSVVLGSKPAENVVVYLQAPKGVELATDVLVFTPTNYSTAQSVAFSLSTDAVLSQEFSADGKFEIVAQAESSASTWFGATIARLAFSVEDYVAFVGDSAVDLRAVGPFAAIDLTSGGSVAWDLNGDGTFETTTDAETSRWTTESDFLGNATSINYKTTNAAGATTAGTLDVVRVDVAPTVDVETTAFAAIPNLIRVAAASQNGAISCWRINWGDGSPLSELNELSTAAEFAHWYEKSGEYVITAELVDANGVGNGIWVEIGAASISASDASNAVFAELAQEAAVDSGATTFDDLDLGFVADF